jgi:UDP-3-O-[3-hydroxymyristoyl] N-acetylglucosamine deacetylase
LSVLLRRSIQTKPEWGPVLTTGHIVQATLKSSITVKGTGLHSGRPAVLTINPSSAHMGIWFKRTDTVDGDPFVPARWDVVEQVPLCTRLVNADGVSVSTVEHLMAALAGCGVHNAVIEVSGPEVPILDGSAAQFVKAILKAGIQRLDAPVRALRILKPVEVRRGLAMAQLVPGDGFSIDFQIEFEDAAIGAQARKLNMANGSFVRELCDSRTFCRQADVDAMRAQGLGLGGSVRNAVVVDGADILTPGGLRHSDEPVRHKMLDALGDLILSGGPIIGHYTGVRAGHALTNALLREVFADPSNYEFTDCGPALAARLPGAGVRAADLRAVA